MSLYTKPRGIRGDALGIGLRVQHYPYIFEHWPEIDFVEIISENFLTDAALPRAKLSHLQKRYPIVLHGVGLNLLGTDPLSETYLDRLCRLADTVDAPYVTDHLCWSGAHGMKHHDLLPVPFRTDLMEWAAERAAYVQKRLGRPFGIENLSSYLEFPESHMTEWDFYNGVVQASGCWYMVDLNNIYVSSVNHSFDPLSYLRSIDFSRVLQVHIAGHQAAEKGILVDTHDRPVCDAVWQLYRQAWREGGPFPTLLEWDDGIPPVPELLGELSKALEVRS